MALIKCSECGKEMSDKAAACPNCGAPINVAKKTPPSVTPGAAAHKKSKKWPYILLVIAGLIIIGSISGKNGDQSATPKQQTSPAANATSVEKSGQQARQEAKEKAAKEKEERQSAFEKAIRATVKKSPDYGDYELQFSELEENRCSVTLTYPKGPMPRSGAELISKAAVLAIIKEFVRQGKNPAEDRTKANSWVQTRTKGVTGQDLFNIYGAASYNYNNDQIEWSPQR